MYTNEFLEGNAVEHAKGLAAVKSAIDGLFIDQRAQRGRQISSIQLVVYFMLHEVF